MENDRKPSLEQVLGKQAVSLLKRAGVHNLRVETDGSVSGEREVLRGLPQTDYISNLSMSIKKNKIVIGGEIKKTITDVGKVI